MLIGTKNTEQYAEDTSNCEAGEVDTLEPAEIDKEINHICTIIIMGIENKSVSIKSLGNSDWKSRPALCCS